MCNSRETVHTLSIRAHPTQSCRRFFNGSTLLAKMAGLAHKGNPALLMVDLDAILYDLSAICVQACTESQTYGSRRFRMRAPRAWSTCYDIVDLHELELDARLHNLPLSA